MRAHNKPVDSGSIYTYIYIYRYIYIHIHILIYINTYILHITRDFHSVKLICRNLSAIFSHVKKAYTANQNGV